MFDFQSVQSGYIADFYFPKQKKIVELDGKKYHDLKKDQRRDTYLRKKGVKTIRIQSRRVFTDIRRVLAQIDNFLFSTPNKYRKRNKKAYRKKLRKELKRLRNVPGMSVIRLHEDPNYQRFLDKVVE